MGRLYRRGMSEFRPRDQQSVLSTVRLAVYCESCCTRGVGLVEMVVLPGRQKLVRIRNSFPGFFILNRRGAGDRLRIHCRACGAAAQWEGDAVAPDGQVA